MIGNSSSDTGIAIQMKDLIESEPGTVYAVAALHHPACGSAFSLDSNAGVVLFVNGTLSSSPS